MGDRDLPRDPLEVRRLTEVLMGSMKMRIWVKIWGTWEGMGAGEGYFLRLFK